VKLLITGANGFLGRSVVAAALHGGHDVRAMVRPAADTDRCGWPGQVDVFRADLRSADDLPRAFEGVDALVHLAACVAGSEEQQFQSTVVGTERLLSAMAASSTRRLVLASSFYVYDWSRVRRVLTEDSPVEADPYRRDGYTIAKVWQERVTRQFAQRCGWQLTVLRPGFIWGPGNEWIARLGQVAGRRHIVVGGRSLGALTHVENCAAFFVRAAECDAAAGETLNVFDGHQIRVWRYAGEYLRRTGTPGRRILVPYWLGISAARCARFVSRCAFGERGKLPSLLTPRLFEARFKPLQFPNHKLVRVLGRGALLSFAECLARTYAAPVGELKAAVAENCEPSHV
jgi:UDP-glucose 4-epimerase